MFRIAILYVWDTEGKGAPQGPFGLLSVWRFMSLLFRVLSLVIDVSLSLLSFLFRF
jgi:hypothetical protein